MNYLTPEAPPVDGTEDRFSAVQRDAREEVRRVVDALGLVLPGEVIEEPRKGGNGVTLASGTYGSPTLRAIHTRILGATAASVISPTTVITQDATFVNAHFKSTDERPGLLVDMTAAGSVSIYIGCVFEKSSNHEGTFIRMVANAQAIFLGCKFIGSPVSAADIFDKPAVPGDVFLIGCYTASASAYPPGSVTQIGSF